MVVPLLKIEKSHRRWSQAQFVTKSRKLIVRCGLRLKSRWSRKQTPLLLRKSSLLAVMVLQSPRTQMRLLTWRAVQRSPSIGRTSASMCPLSVSENTAHFSLRERQPQAPSVVVSCRPLKLFSGPGGHFRRGQTRAAPTTVSWRGA